MNYEIKQASPDELAHILETGKPFDRRTIHRPTFERLRVGSYFEFDREKRPLINRMCQYYGKALGRRFSIRKHMEDTFRVYRVE